MMPTDKKAADISPASALIGSDFRGWDAETLTATFDYTAPASFANAFGAVQGGLIGGFLDEVMGAALWCHSGGKMLPTTLDINMTIIRPVPIGPLVAKGRAIKVGRRVAYLEGELFDEGGKLLARSTATCIPTPIGGGE